MTNQKTQTAIAVWSWLVPITFLIHITEELFGGEGYPAYIKRLRGVQLTSTKFLVGQAIALALIVAAIVIARRFNFPEQMLVILSSVVLVNGLTHLGTSAYYQEYGPGLISGALIWIPFGIAALVRTKDSVKPARYWLYIALGVGINVAIALITLNGDNVSS